MDYAYCGNAMRVRWQLPGSGWRSGGACQLTTMRSVLAVLLGGFGE